MRESARLRKTNDEGHNSYYLVTVKDVFEKRSSCLMEKSWLVNNHPNSELAGLKKIADCRSWKDRWRFMGLLRLFGSNFYLFYMAVLPVFKDGL